MGVRRVALVEDRVAEPQRRLQVRVEVGQPAAGDEALVDDGPGRGRRDRDLGEGAAGGAGRRLEPTSGDDQPPLEGVVGQRPGVVRRRAPGASTMAWAKAGRDAPPTRRAPRRRRDRPPGGDRQAGLGEGRLDEGPGAPFGAERPRGRKSDTIAGRVGRRAASRRSASSSERSSGRATPAPSLDSPSAPNAPRWPSAAETGQRQRQHPIARLATRVRDEPDATGVVLEARVVQRGGGATVAVCVALVPWLGLRREGRIGRRREGSTAAGRGSADVGRGRRPGPSRLIGDLAVDGEVQAHRLGFGLDPDAEQDVDDLDDDEGADDRVADRRPRPR